MSLCFPFVFEACVRIKCPNFFCLLFTASVWLLEFIWCYFGCLSLVTKNQLLAIICSYVFGALAAISFCICSFFFAIAFLFAFSLAFEACLRVTAIFFAFAVSFLHLHFCVFVFFFCI